MRSTDDHEHAWAQARLELHRARLLVPDADERLLAHAATCASCRVGLETAGGPDALAGQHVPASVLARWPGVAADLPALERELVEHHLAECVDCRGDLLMASTTVANTRPVLASVRWERVWAIAATAAAASLAVMWWAAPRGPRGPERHLEPAVRFTGPAPKAPLQLMVTPSPVALRDVVRGDGPPAATTIEPLELEPVVLSFDPFDVPDDTPVKLELSTAAGVLQASTVRTQAELYPHRQIVIGDGTHPLADGDYVLRVIAWPGRANTDTQSFALTVRRRR